MQPTAPDSPDSPPARRAVGMPRQYGVRTMLIITAIYAVFFALLASVEADPIFFIAPGIFLAGVGLAQMFFFRGTRPREASLLAGSLLLTAGAAAAVAMMHIAGERGDGVLLWLVVAAPALGAALGYLVGAAIAGPFLLANRLRQRREAARHAPNAQPNASNR
jgi:hypothetical protein